MVMSVALYHEYKLSDMGNFKIYIWRINYMGFIVDTIQSMYYLGVANYTP